MMAICCVGASSAAASPSARLRTASACAASTSQSTQRAPLAASRGHGADKLDGRVATAFVAAAAAAALALPVHAADVEAVFERSCAGCHAGGGNVVAPGVTLQLADLQKYKLDDTEALYNLIYKGRGKMPGFGVECAPKGQCTFGPRLADEDVQALADYVLARANQGWAK